MWEEPLVLPVRPEAAMYVVEMVLIFSMQWNSGSLKICEFREENS
jgi:hypothetical protein